MSLARRPSLPPMPDLGHLTEEERQVIESVIQRQREEEEKEQEILRTLKDEYDTYQASVKKLSEESKVTALGQQGAVCQICHKTKFADGIGHKCHYCGVQSCARCGGKMGLKGNKQIWACNLCKKSKEILLKTGQWYHGGMAKPVALDVGDTGSETSSIKTDASPPHEKKPKFPDHQLPGQYSDGGQSSEKENIVQNIPPGRTPPSGKGDGHLLSRSGSQLRRQYSLSDGIGHRGNTPSSVGYRGGLAECEQEPRDRHRSRERVPHQGEPREPSRTRSAGGEPTMLGENRSKDTTLPGRPMSQEHFGRDHYIDDRHPCEKRRVDSTLPDDRVTRDMDIRERRLPRDGRDIASERQEFPATEGPVLRPVDERPVERPPSRERSRDEIRHRDESRHRDSREPLDRRKDDIRRAEERDEMYPRERRDASSERCRHVERPGERAREPRDRDLGERDVRAYPHLSAERPVEGERRRSRDDRSGYFPEHSPIMDLQLRSERRPERLMRGHGQSAAKDLDAYDKYPTKVPVPATRRVDRHDHDDFEDNYSDRSMRQQHLDPNSAMAKSSRSRSRKFDSMLRNDSLSSDPSDCVRPPPPKPHKHKKGKKQRQASLSSSDDEIQTTPECTSCDEQEIESESVSEKEPLFQNRDFTYHGYDREEFWRKDEILAAKIKKFLTHPVTWQPTADGQKLEGHMILRKAVEGHHGDNSGILGKGTLGLKVTGGKMTEAGYLGAFITKVKKGSIADTVGHLRAGDEVIEWNGRTLRGLTFEEVYDIIFESKQEPQVELVVQRPISTGELPPGIPELPDLEAGIQKQTTTKSR